MMTIKIVSIIGLVALGILYGLHLSKKRPKKPSQIAALIGIVAVLIMVIFISDFNKLINRNQPIAGTNNTKNVRNEISNGKMDNSMKLYENKEFHVTLQYPKNWKANNQYMNRYEGEDGYFQIMAYDGENQTIDEVATHEVAHKLKPYGSKPVISPLFIRGQEARLITPSDDQSKEYQQQAEIIIKYPSKILIDGQTYSYLLVVVDKNHISKIGNTVKVN